MPRESDFPTDLQQLERDYELIREIGQGGMAAVYLARRRATAELVAIKAVRARYLDDPDALARFAREARTVAELNHPNIVRTEAIEQIGDRAVAIIMEHIAGGTVRDRLRERGPLSAEHAESVLRDVANALGYAHRRGIVHRDVKPENVFLDERTGRAVLSDFGIARRIEGEAALTLLGAPLGTPAYMSPEQIEGGVVDGRSDIYSLGVLGWELLTGRRPWAGESLYSIIYKQKHEELPRITSIRPRVPANLLFAIEGALAKDLTRRWQSIDEFLQQLTYDPPPVLDQTQPAAAPRTDDEPTVRFRRDTAHAAAAAPLATPDPGRPTAERRVRSAPAAPPPRPTTRASASRRRGFKPGRIARAVALVVPLAIAGTAAYIVLGDRRPGVSRRDSQGPLESSGGSVALDTTVSDSPRASAAPAPVPAAEPRSPDTIPAPKPRVADTASAAKPLTPDTPTAPAARAPDTSRDVRVATEQPPDSAAVRRNTERIDSAPAAGPSPRCRVASMADQRACLLAYVAVNDTMLQRVYDSLIVELRRSAGVGRGEPDPPAVTRLRVEQREWIRARDRECTRDPAPGSVPLWAHPVSECFARRSISRAQELREAYRRVPGAQR